MGARRALGAAAAARARVAARFLRVRPILGLGAALAAGFGVATCRDAPELIEPPELPPLSGAAYQLTFDPGREVSPSWSASGDSVIYVTERLMLPIPLNPDTMRVGRPLKVIHREGGVADRVFPLLQLGADGTLPIDHAVQSADGPVAALTLLPLLPRTFCGGVPFCVPELVSETPPRLSQAVLRMRDPGAGGGPESDPQLTIEFPGRAFDTSQNPGGLTGVWLIDTHPFQRHFNLTRRAPDRISWSPDGNRVVFSDGVSLNTWTPSSGDVETIPGSDDGINPAWSPTGEWIAFERFERGPLTEAVCEHRVPPDVEGDPPGPVLCVENRRHWPVIDRSLAVIAPDGSDLRLLPEGARPAWGPDGQRLYYEHQGAIWSVGVDGVNPAPVAGTSNGFHPAVSPDGRWLAFARIEPATALSNIWIVELEP